jgi:hypothetical protein
MEAKTNKNSKESKGEDELKQAKIDVKTSTFLQQFLLHLFMWCHFNGM